MEKIRVEHISGELEPRRHFAPLSGNWGDSRYTVGQRVVDDARRLGGGIVLLYKGTGNVHQSHVVIVDVVELQSYLGHFISGS